MIIYVYICTWIRYIFVRDCDFINMIMDKLTMNWFWYPNQWGLFIGTLIPSQWGSFIGILIPKPMRVVHWYSDTQTNGGCSLVFWYPFWYPNHWGLFIGTLTPKPMGVVHWYSDTQTNGGYSLVLWCLVTGIECDHSHKIVKNMNYDSF